MISPASGLNTSQIMTRRVVFVSSILCSCPRGLVDLRIYACNLACLRVQDAPACQYIVCFSYNDEPARSKEEGERE